MLIMTTNPMEKVLVGSSKIEKRREEFLSGRLNSIPFRIHRLNRFIPGIIRGSVDCVTANTNIGKTTLTKKLYVFDAIRFALQNDINLKILYFGLEESLIEFQWSLYSYVAYGLSNGMIRYDMMDFEHYYTPLDGDNPEDFTIPAEDIQKIKDLRVDEEVQKWMNYVQYYENVYNSYGIYKEVRTVAGQRGTFYKDGRPVPPDLLENGWDEYRPDDSDEFVVVITDHVGELHEQKDEGSLREAIRKLVNFGRHYITKKFNYTFISVHQQFAEQEDLDHFKSRYMKPTMQGLGDNKTVGRSYMRTIGLFDPYRYGIKTYAGYRLDDFTDYSRFLNFPKNRHGKLVQEVGLFFDGKTGHIETLPRPEDEDGIARIIDRINSFKQ